MAVSENTFWDASDLLATTVSSRVSLCPSAQTTEPPLRAGEGLHTPSGDLLHRTTQAGNDQPTLKEVVFFFLLIVESDDGRWPKSTSSINCKCPSLLCRDSKFQDVPGSDTLFQLSFLSFSGLSAQAVMWRGGATILVVTVSECTFSRQAG